MVQCQDTMSLLTNIWIQTGSHSLCLRAAQATGRKSLESKTVSKLDVNRPYLDVQPNIWMQGCLRLLSHSQCFLKIWILLATSNCIHELECNNEKVEFVYWVKRMQAEGSSIEGHSWWRTKGLHVRRYISPYNVRPPSLFNAFLWVVEAAKATGKRLNRRSFLVANERASVSFSSRGLIVQRCVHAAIKPGRAQKFSTSDKTSAWMQDYLSQTLYILDNLVIRSTFFVM